MKKTQLMLMITTLVLLSVFGTTIVLEAEELETTVVLFRDNVEIHSNYAIRCEPWSEWEELIRLCVEDGWCYFLYGPNVGTFYKEEVRTRWCFSTWSQERWEEHELRWVKVAGSCNCQGPGLLPTRIFDVIY